MAGDIRKGSPTYGQHVAVELTEDNHRQFFVPRGFAHGFAVLSATALFQYKCDNFYAPQADGGISIKDESLGIDWRIPVESALLSEKDTKHAPLNDFDSPFIIEMDLYPEFKWPTHTCAPCACPEIVEEVARMSTGHNMSRHCSRKSQSYKECCV